MLFLRVGHFVVQGKVSFRDERQARRLDAVFLVPGVGERFAG